MQPSWAFSPYTLDLIRKKGFLYDSSLSAMDEPYEIVTTSTPFVLTLHPYLSGHRAPMYHLNELVAYMKSKPGVWFATGSQIAMYFAMYLKSSQQEH